MMTPNMLRARSAEVLRSEGDFDAMWREIAQTSPRVWSIAHEPLAGLFSIWEPRLELSEDDEHYLLRAELPGMQRDDMTVEYHEGILTIRGEQRIASAPEEHKPRIQHGYRAFTRRFVLQEPVVAEAMITSYTPGGLEVFLPKAATLAAQSMPLLAAS